MNEEFYNELVYELNRVKDIKGGIVQLKEWNFRGKDIEYAVMFTRIDDIRIKIDNVLLVYNNGVYSSVDTAILAGMSLKEIEEEGYYDPDIDHDIKETVDAAVAEFYKTNFQ